MKGFWRVPQADSRLIPSRLIRLSKSFNPGRMTSTSEINMNTSFQKSYACCLKLCAIDTYS